MGKKLYTITNLLKWNHYISYMGRIVFIGKLVQKFQACLWSTFELREILVVHSSSNLYEWLALDRFNRQSFLELLIIWSEFFLWFTLKAGKDYISGCGSFSFNSQSVSLLQAYLLLELLCSALLAEASGKCPFVFGVTCVFLLKEIQKIQFVIQAFISKISTLTSIFPSPNLKSLVLVLSHSNKNTFFF